LWQFVAAGSIGLTGIAAAVGSLRFAGVYAVRSSHEFLTALAMYVSMPLLGLVGILAYVAIPSDSPLPLVTAAALVFGFLCFKVFFPKQLKPLEENYVMMTGLFGIMCVFFRAAFILLGKSGSGNEGSYVAGWYGIVGASLVIIASAVGSTGQVKFGPLQALKVDIFHYLLAAANICLVHLFIGMWQ